MGSGKVVSGALSVAQIVPHSCRGQTNFVFATTLVVISISGQAVDMYDLESKNVESHFVRTMYTCYTDILLIVLPFVVAGFVRGWQGESLYLLQHTDISVATCILAGLSVARLMQSLIGDRSLTRYKVRFVLAIAAILTVLVGPSLIHIVHSLYSPATSSHLSFLLPLLLVVSITVYSISFNLSYLINNVFVSESADSSLK